MATKPPLKKTLKELMDAHGLKSADLSKQTTLPQTTIRYILQGITDNPRIDTVMQLAQFFQVPIELLLGLKDERQSPPPSPQKKSRLTHSQAKTTIHIPLIDWNEVKFWCANNRAHASIDCKSWIACKSSLPKESFALNVTYEGRGVFLKNSIIIINPQHTFKPDDYVVASVKKNKPTLKQIWQESNQVYLNAVGGNIPSIKLEPPHIVFGTIVESRTYFT